MPDEAVGIVKEGEVIMDFVSWEGYNSEEDSTEPEGFFLERPELLFACGQTLTTYNEHKQRVMEGQAGTMCLFFKKGETDYTMYKDYQILKASQRVTPNPESSEPASKSQHEHEAKLTMNVEMATVSVEMATVNVELVAVTPSSILSPAILDYR